MILTDDIKDRLKNLSERIRNNQASNEEYREYEMLLIKGGVSPEKVKERLILAGFNSWEDYVEIRRQAQTLEDKKKIQEAFVIGGLIGLGLGVIIGLISIRK